MGNADKHPSEWDPDIVQSVSDYNDWYRADAPDIYAAARDRSAEYVARAFDATDAFTKLTPTVLEHRPDVLFAARQALAPPLARDRLVTLAGVPKNLVKVMEERNSFPARAVGLAGHLDAICETLNSLLDPALLAWVHQGGIPSEIERDRAIAVVSDRLARAIADPNIRNRQEKRMRGTMEKFLRSRGLEPTTAATFSMPRGSYVVSRDMPVERSGTSVGLQVDVMICPRTRGLPIVACEQKSAGDFTNVNKRRKEEAAKADGLRDTYGDDVAFLLHLFGYFDRNYLSYERGHGIDWAWDHRLSDLDEHL